VKIHIAVVSDQTLANLIPILMERPDKVYLICSETMRERGLEARLMKACEREKISVETKAGAPSAGLESIHKYALSLADEIRRKHPNAEVVFNATGGTKLMSLGFVEVFRHLARIIYTDTSNKRIEVFPNGSARALPPVEMTDVLDVPRYLAAQGFRYQKARSEDPSWEQQVDSRRALCSYLAQQVKSRSIQQFIHVVNSLAQAAMDERTQSLRNPVQTFPTFPRGLWEKALAETCRAGLIDWHQGSRDLKFLHFAAAVFLSGGWLEEYVWHVARSEAIHDARCGVDVISDELPHLRNEFDLLACHRNELLVIECKTLDYRNQKDSDVAYKIDSLGQRLRGLFGETWLLSAREPTATLLERARQARFRIIGPDGLGHLGAAIRAWILSRG
jgi:hypothetical protein